MKLDQIEANCAAARRLLPADRLPHVYDVVAWAAQAAMSGPPLDGATWTNPGADAAPYVARWEVALDGLTVYGLVTTQQAQAWGCPADVLSDAADVAVSS